MPNQEPEHQACFRARKTWVQVLILAMGPYAKYLNLSKALVLYVCTGQYESTHLTGLPETKEPRSLTSVCGAQHLLTYFYR